jgi:glyoxylase-like metal-dependent hydrolase (beta-lactamase superfamily II)
MFPAPRLASEAMPADRILQWTVGDLQIHRIVEVANHADPIGILLKDATERIFDPFTLWLRPHFITDADQMLIQWQAFAIRTPRLNLMIDTCIGNDRKRFFQVFNDMHTPFLEDLASCGFIPHDIDLVCCTHLHYDHVGWNTHLENGKWTPTFPNAVYLIDNTEYAGIRELQASGDWHGQHLPDSIDPIVAAGLHKFIDAPGYRVCDEIWLEHTPGHTPGHCAVHIESGGQHAIITGDLMHHPVQVAVPPWRGNFDHDPDAATRTRVKFVSTYSDRQTLIIGSHFAGLTAGWIIPNGEHCRFVTERPTR